MVILMSNDMSAPPLAAYARFRLVGEPPRESAERRAELDRILVGNLLTMSQGLGWFFEQGETVYAAAEVSRDVSCVVKSTSLVGFEGSFVTNLELPDHLAIGRSVSHGFGCFAQA